MLPTPFPESNFTLTAPEPNDTGVPVGDLPCHRYSHGFVSRWKLSWRERFSALFFGVMWANVMQRDSHPPIGFVVSRKYFIPRITIPKCFHRRALGEPRFDITVFTKHDLVVPQYPQLSQRVLFGVYRGLLLTAYNGCLYTFREERLADDVACDQNWHPRRQRAWATLDELETLRLEREAAQGFEIVSK